jgi:hypothetical protein
MTIYTYRIELRIDVDEAAHAAVSEIVKQYARDILASGTMMCLPRFKPQVMVTAADTFFNNNEIALLDPSERVIEPNE